MSEYGKTSTGKFYDGSSGEGFIKAIYEARGDVVKALPDGMFGHDLWNESTQRYVEIEHRQSIAFDNSSIVRWLEDGYFIHIPKRRIKSSGPQFDFIVLSADYKCAIIIRPYLVDWSSVDKDFINCAGRTDGYMYRLFLSKDNYGEVWDRFYP